MEQTSVCNLFSFRQVLIRLTFKENKSFDGRTKIFFSGVALTEDEFLFYRPFYGDVVRLELRLLRRLLGLYCFREAMSSYLIEEESDKSPTGSG